MISHLASGNIYTTNKLIDKKSFYAKLNAYLNLPQDNAMKKVLQIKVPMNINEIASILFTSDMDKDFGIALEKCLNTPDDKAIEYLDTQVNQTTSQISEYSGDKTSEQFVCANQKLALLKTIQHMITPSNGVTDQNLKENTLFLLCAKNNPEMFQSVAAKTFINRVKTIIQDEQIRYQTFKHFAVRNIQSKETDRQYRVAIVECKKYATLHDWYTLLLTYQDTDSMLRIFQQMEKVACDQIVKIKSTHSRNADTTNAIKDIVTNMQLAIDNIADYFGFEEKYAAQKIWLNDVRSKYSLANIANTDVDFVKKLPETSFVQIDTLKQKLKYEKLKEQSLLRTIEDKNAEINNLKIEAENARKIADMYKEKTTHLEKINNEIAAETKQISTENAELQKKINQITEKNTELEKTNAKLEAELNSLRDGNMLNKIRQTLQKKNREHQK